VVEKVEKLTIAQRWEKMLSETKAKVEAEHAAEEATPPRITPIQRRLLKEIEEFQGEITWTINHIVVRRRPSSRTPSFACLSILKDWTW